MHPEAKFHAAVRWLRDQARARKLREEEIRRYVWWTLCAAVLSLIVGVIVLAVTWFWRLFWRRAPRPTTMGGQRSDRCGFRLISGACVGKSVERKCNTRLER